VKQFTGQAKIDQQAGSRNAMQAFAGRGHAVPHAIDGQGHEPTSLSSQFETSPFDKAEFLIGHYVREMIAEK
jgi:hypothetical protein